MFRYAAAVGLALLMAAPAAAQGAKAKAPKGIDNDITISADAVYTGTMSLAIDKGRVTGTLRIAAPTDIRGEVAGTSSAGTLSLDFPYTMVERGCTGTVKMRIALPPKPGPAKGTMEAVGCGRDASNAIQGTVELVPHAPKKK